MAFPTFVRRHRQVYLLLPPVLLIIIFTLYSMLPPAFAPSVTMSAAPKTYHAVRCTDKPSTIALRKSTRAAHLTWAANNGVVFGGPLLDASSSPTGSVLVLSGDNTTVAAALAADPYATAGLFSSVEVRKWVLGMRSDALGAGGAGFFCIWCVDKPGMMALRADTRPRHLEWWKSAGRQGMIGPFPEEGGAVGTMIVCQGEGIEEVEAWAATDPYAKAGLFESVEVSRMGKSVDTIF